MGRLKSALLSKYHEKDEVIHIYTPRNTETVKLYFRGEKLARVSTFKVKLGNLSGSCADQRVFFYSRT